MAKPALLGLLGYAEGSGTSVTATLTSAAPRSNGAPGTGYRALAAVVMLADVSPVPTVTITDDAAAASFNPAESAANNWYTSGYDNMSGAVLVASTERGFACASRVGDMYQGIAVGEHVTATVPIACAFLGLYVFAWDHTAPGTGHIAHIGDGGPIGLGECDDSYSGSALYGDTWGNANAYEVDELVFVGIAAGYTGSAGEYAAAAVDESDTTEDFVGTWTQLYAGSAPDPGGGFWPSSGPGTARPGDFIFTFWRRTLAAGATGVRSGTFRSPPTWQYWDSGTKLAAPLRMFAVTRAVEDYYAALPPSPGVHVWTRFRGN